MVAIELLLASTDLEVRSPGSNQQAFVWLLKNIKFSIENIL